jgi:N6-adenosine-specific RNA methylase IME4
MDDLESLEEIPLDLISLSTMTSPIHSSQEKTIDQIEDVLDLFNHYYTNDSEKSLVLPIANIRIPPRSKFLMSDLNYLKPLLRFKYALIVMDPPWINHSVARSQHYPMLDCYELFKLPVASWLQPHGLVCIWVTNHPKYHEFIKQKLLKAYQCELVGCWKWTKCLNASGETRQSNPKHRQPFEKVYIARKRSSTHHEDLKDFPKDFEIRAMPGIHSQKPRLEAYLKPFVPKGEYLELFSRQLISGYTS